MFSGFACVLVPPAAGRRMGLGGPSFASRDSGLTPDGSTILRH